jgi:hypothetical protein
MKLIATSGLLLMLVHCKQSQRSVIEVIKFDNQIIVDLQKGSDTTYTEYTGQYESYLAEYYVNRSDSVITKILKDSFENVVGLHVSKNDHLLVVAEYHRNGQLKGKLPEKIKGKYNGQARYYFEDGRVRAEGQFHNGLWSGEWKNYDEKGHLVSIDDFGAGNINPIKTIKVK